MYHRSLGNDLLQLIMQVERDRKKSCLLNNHAGFIVLQSALVRMVGCRYLPIVNIITRICEIATPIAPTLMETWNWHGCKMKILTSAFCNTSVRSLAMSSFHTWMSPKSFCPLCKSSEVEPFSSSVSMKTSLLWLWPFPKCIIWNYPLYEVSFLWFFRQIAMLVFLSKAFSREKLSNSKSSFFSSNRNVLIWK